MLRDWFRVLVIVARTLPLVASFRRDFKRWFRWGAPMQRDRAFHEQRAAKIVHSVSSLGAAFVKVAQIFATRADLVPEPYLAALGTLTDRVPEVPWPLLRQELAAAWGVDPDTVVQDLNPVPLAAGSLGQVHRASYQGREVVLKILRPHVDDIVYRDVRIAKAFVRWLYKRMPNHHVLGFQVVLNEFDIHVREEMDFEREGAQCARMRERFSDEPRLRIPRVEAPLTRRNVLVMEYMHGTRIDALDSRVAAGTISPRTLVETLIECYARMMLRDGVFHADPHPGNLLVDDKGVLILLDFGMVIEVSVETRKAMFDTIVAAIRRDAEGTMRGFYALGMVAPGTTQDTMLALVKTLMDIAYSEEAMEARARILADQVLHELFDWPIILPGELVYFARTAALIEGIGARYDRNFNSIRVASPVVLKLRKELLAALLGEDPSKTDTVTEWAATLGAVVGGATAALQRMWQSFSSKTEVREQPLLREQNGAAEQKMLENPLTK